jgi:hypothetical protein
MANWKNIMTQVGTALGLLTDKMSRLESQRDAARTTLQKARAALQTHLLDGDDGDDKTVAALQAKIDTAQSLLESLDEAVRTQSERVAEAEREASDKETKRQRLAASEIIANDVARIDAQLKPWLAATRALATDLAKYGTARFECGSIGAYLANLAAETEVALAVSIPDLKGYVIAVAEGREKIPVMPGTVVKMPAPKPPAPTTQRFFLSRNIAFYDAQGGKHCAPSLTDFDLPVGLITKATEFGAIHAMDSAVRKKNHGGKSQSSKPAFEHCVWLNGDPTAKSYVEPVRSSHLGDPQPMDRGPVRTGTLAPLQSMANTRTEKPRS